MNNIFFRRLATCAVAASLLTAAGCQKDLEQTPSYEPTVATVYGDPAAYKQVLARLYATLAVSGQRGPAGLPDIGGIDEGFSNYLRQYWMAQELTTDEAIIAWNDGNLPDYNKLTWNSSNEFVRAMYDRIFYQVSLCNEFIRQSTDARLNGLGVSEAELTNLRAYRAEARFLRALAYYHALDMFGNVPFADETSAVGITPPSQISRADLFVYVEQELKAIEAELIAPHTEYGRADQAAAWTLLAKLYLNAPVYVGQDRGADVITYCNKVLGSNSYSLAPSYQNLFLADNNRTSAQEIIFPINFDGVHTKTFGGMTFIIHAAVGGDMKAANFGINGGWGGTRTKPELVNLFPDVTGAADKRAMFFTDGQQKQVQDIFTFTDGYAVTKFRNVTSTGVPGSDTSGDFPDTDFPLFRLADVYLMYAEATVRGAAGGDAGLALQYINALRTRAGAATVAAGDIAFGAHPTFLLDERGRELYWEATRRTDLIRFGRYTSGDYVWAFKGGAPAGQGVSEDLRLFPIPATDLAANPNLKQNRGY